jgi:hypothetical protein
VTAAQEKAKAVIREAVMEATRIIHADECPCERVPGVFPPPPYRSGWVETGIEFANAVLTEMENER